MNKLSEDSHSCGLVAIVGRPNVGKSTLLNYILGQKLSITSRKPQTTRHQILGVKTCDRAQAVFIDTPGFQSQQKCLANRLMNRAATNALHDVDIVIFIIDARCWTNEDELVLKLLTNISGPVFLVLNKVDLIKDKVFILSVIEQLSQKREFVEIIPLSLKSKINLDLLEEKVFKLLPKKEHLFPEGTLTNLDDSFLIREIIREKIMRLTGMEVPYNTATTINSMQMKGKVLHLDVIIWVERRGQKIIIIGKNGERLKKIGQQSRQDIERMVGCKVFLSLWVKIKSGWSEDKQTLTDLGFGY